MATDAGGAGEHNPHLVKFTAENISDIVREAVGGVKSYIYEALAQQKEKTSKSIESSKVQFKFKGNRVQFNFNISLLDSVRASIAWRDCLGHFRV